MMQYKGLVRFLFTEKNQPKINMTYEEEVLWEETEAHA